MDETQTYQPPKKHSLKPYGLVVLLVLGVFLFVMRTQYQKVPAHIPQVEAKVVATDPSFLEAKGALLPGFPEFPTYPSSVLVGSAQTHPPDQPVLGFRAKWISHDSVSEVMEWFTDELSQNGWTIEAPNDENSEGEQVAQIDNGEWKGYIAAEIEEGNVEIVVDVKEL